MAGAAAAAAAEAAEEDLLAVAEEEDDEAAVAAGAGADAAPYVSTPFADTRDGCCCSFAAAADDEALVVVPSEDDATTGAFGFDVEECAPRVHPCCKAKRSPIQKREEFIDRRIGKRAKMQGDSPSKRESVSIHQTSSLPFLNAGRV